MYITWCSSLGVDMHTKHLAKKRIHYSRLPNKIMVHVQGDMESCPALSIHVDSVLEQMPGSVIILQPILHMSTEEAFEDRLFAAL